MKTIKYLAATLAIVFALAGCTGSSGTANFDSIYPASNDLSEQGAY